MSIEHREHASVVTHALAQHTRTELRSVDTEQVAFRKGLVRLGRLCGYESIDEWMQTTDVPARRHRDRRRSNARDRQHAVSCPN